MTPDQFRVLGHRLIDWIADYRTRVADFPVMARTAPGEVRAQLPTAPPGQPEAFERTRWEQKQVGRLVCEREVLVGNAPQKVHTVTHAQTGRQLLKGLAHRAVATDVVVATPLGRQGRHPRIAVSMP